MGTQEMKNRRSVVIKAGQRVVVVGLGRSGRAAVRFLLTLGARVMVSEGGRRSRLDKGLVQWLQEKGVHLETGGHSSALFTSADWVLVSPGVPLDLPALVAARRAGVPVIGELALARTYLRTPVAAVTGTNGKTTVTTLLGELLRAGARRVFVGGNIGVPLCEYLAGPQDADWAVLEVSSFQLDTATGFQPEVAVVLNISPDHLDRYPSFAAYAAAKLVLLRHQSPAQVAVVNGCDPEIFGRLQSGPAESPATGAGQRWWFGAAGPEGPLAMADRPGRIVVSGVGASQQTEIYDLGATSLAAAPNLQNAMAAILAARACGVSVAEIHQGLRRFTPLPHRLTLVAHVGGVAFFDDSKATNCGAVQAALAGMDRPVVLIAGGRDKDGDFSTLRELVSARVTGLVLLGEASDKLAAALGDLVPVIRADGMAAAVDRAFALARPGEAVLLSPGCASFDMFRDYIHRGRVFQREVARLQRTTARNGDEPGGCPVVESLVC